MLYPWQHSLWNQVYQQYQHERLPHAILFNGAEGLGKVEFARALAQTVLCESSEQACGQCRSCELFLAENHPDFFNVTLLEKAKGIKVDQIRELSFALSLSPQMAKYQVVLIHPAENLNQASSNALLKTLEEPPGNVVITLIANALAGIPATILSRTQRFNFIVPEPTQVLPWLHDQLGSEAEQAEALLQLANGSPKRALALAKSDALKLRNLVLRELWYLLKGESEVATVAAQFAKEDTSQVLGAIFAIALDVMRLKAQFPESSLQNQVLVKQLGMIRDQLNIILLAQFLSELLLESHRLQFAAGINVQLLIENVLIRWKSLRN